jgi:hypothetical protein
MRRRSLFAGAFAGVVASLFGRKPLLADTAGFAMTPGAPVNFTITLGRKTYCYDDDVERWVVTDVFDSRTASWRTAKLDTTFFVSEGMYAPHIDDPPWVCDALARAFDRHRAQYLPHLADWPTHREFKDRST